jgi:cell division protein FtsI (penicillin-binding protein 3)
LKNVRITIFLFAFLIVTLLAMALRCFYLQSIKSQHYSSIWQKQRQRLEPQKPQRGVILDCRGTVLAASNKVQTVFAEPRAITDPKEASNNLALVIDMPAHEICKIITESKNPGFAKIKTNLEPDQYESAVKIHGIGVQSEWQRHYPTGTLAPHVVGFTSRDNRGLAGIEIQYEKALAGSAGQNVFFADALRRPIRPKQFNPSVNDGFGIILTLDATIQQFARTELLKQFREYQAESAVAIVAEPKSGAILAMVSLPEFDPNNTTSTDPNNFKNRAVTDTFEPGSVLKPIIAAIALDANVVNTTEKIFCENGHYHGRGFGSIKEYRYHQYGDMTVKQILVKSSNIGMAKIGQKLGKQKLYEGLTHFGFGRKTGIDLPGEAPGLLWPTQKWTGYSLTRIPFGQEISVTALQLVRAFCILANSGKMVRPFLVKATVDNNGKIVKLKTPSPPVGSVIKPQIAQWIVNDALTAVINEGTGKRAKLEKYQLFGKTGTANIAKKDSKGYDDDAYIASFIAGAPAHDPAIVVLVSVRKPDRSLGKGYTGGTVASPVAAKIISKTLNYLEKQSF